MKDYAVIIKKIFDEREKKEKRILEHAERNIENAIKCFEDLNLYCVDIKLDDAKQNIIIERENVETGEFAGMIFEKMIEIVQQNEITNAFYVCVAEDRKSICITLKA